MWTFKNEPILKIFKVNKSIKLSLASSLCKSSKQHLFSAVYAVRFVFCLLSYTGGHSNMGRLGSDNYPLAKLTPALYKSHNCLCYSNGVAPRPNTNTHNLCTASPQCKSECLPSVKHINYWFFLIHLYKEDFHLLG